MSVHIGNVVGSSPSSSLHHHNILSSHHRLMGGGGIVVLDPSSASFKSSSPSISSSANVDTSSSPPPTLPILLSSQVPQTVIVKKNNLQSDQSFVVVGHHNQLGSASSTDDLLQQSYNNGNGSMTNTHHHHHHQQQQQQHHSHLHSHHLNHQQQHQNYLNSRATSSMTAGTNQQGLQDSSMTLPSSSSSTTATNNVTTNGHSTKHQRSSATGTATKSSNQKSGNSTRSSSHSGDGKKTKGRVKIKMEFIDNKLRRYTTFSKRKTGIMKKAYELSTLTGTQVMLLVASETGHVYTFATRKLQPMITSDAGKALIQTCLNSPDTGGSLITAATTVATASLNNGDVVSSDANSTIVNGTNGHVTNNHHQPQQHLNDSDTGRMLLLNSTNGRQCTTTPNNQTNTNTTTTNNNNNNQPDQRMSATGFEETELSYSVSGDDCSHLSDKNIFAGCLPPSCQNNQTTFDAQQNSTNNLQKNSSFFLNGQAIEAGSDLERAFCLGDNSTLILSQSEEDEDDDDDDDYDDGEEDDDHNNDNQDSQLNEKRINYLNSGMVRFSSNQTVSQNFIQRHQQTSTAKLNNNRLNEGMKSSAQSISNQTKLNLNLKIQQKQQQKTKPSQKSQFISNNKSCPSKSSSQLLGNSATSLGQTLLSKNSKPTNKKQNNAKNLKFNKTRHVDSSLNNNYSNFDPISFLDSCFPINESLIVDVNNQQLVDHEEQIFMLPPPPPTQRSQHNDPKSMFNPSKPCAVATTTTIVVAKNQIASKSNESENENKDKASVMKSVGGPKRKRSKFPHATGSSSTAGINNKNFDKQRQSTKQQHQQTNGKNILVGDDDGGKSSPTTTKKQQLKAANLNTIINNLSIINNNHNLCYSNMNQHIGTTSNNVDDDHHHKQQKLSRNSFGSRSQSIIDQSFDSIVLEQNSSSYSVEKNDAMSVMQKLLNSGNVVFCTASNPPMASQNSDLLPLQSNRAFFGSVDTSSSSSLSSSSSSSASHQQQTFLLSTVNNVVPSSSEISLYAKNVGSHLSSYSLPVSSSGSLSINSNQNNNDYHQGLFSNFISMDPRQNFILNMVNNNHQQHSTTPVTLLSTSEIYSNNNTTQSQMMLSGSLNSSLISYKNNDQTMMPNDDILSIANDNHLSNNSNMNVRIKQECIDSIMVMSDCQQPNGINNEPHQSVIFSKNSNIQQSSSLKMVPIIKDHNATITPSFTKKSKTIERQTYFSN